MQLKTISLSAVALCGLLMVNMQYGKEKEALDQFKHDLVTGVKGGVVTSLLVTGAPLVGNKLDGKVQNLQAPINFGTVVPAAAGLVTLTNAGKIVKETKDLSVQSVLTQFLAGWLGYYGTQQALLKLAAMMSYN